MRIHQSPNLDREMESASLNPMSRMGALKVARQLTSAKFRVWCRWNLFEKPFLHNCKLSQTFPVPNYCSRNSYRYSTRFLMGE